MSLVGKNIKKIRNIKGWSQTEFADKFDLKRSNIGSYEEGRAEPKLANLISIANYFNISLDLLLAKEISMNDLYSLDKFLVTSKNSKASIQQENTIPLNSINGESSMFLPKEWGDCSVAFEVNSNYLSASNFYKGDILMTSSISIEDLTKRKPKALVVLNSKKEYQISVNYFLKDDKVHLFEFNEQYKVKELNGVFQVLGKMTRVI